MPYTSDQLLPISALQHLMFCERQAALIHVEGLWNENRYTAEGALLHEKAHSGQAEHRASQGVKVQRAVKLASYELGLFGVADVIEFRQDSAPLVIEYKRGKPKKHSADEVQLCAQALCLEEMLSFLTVGQASRLPSIYTSLPQGAIFYGQTRRRQDVPFDDSLRTKTKNAVNRLHEMIAHNETPTAQYEKKCKSCSMLNLCMPTALKPRATAARYFENACISAVNS